MRRALTILTTVALTAVVLTGCTPPQNEEAAAAATEYSESLSTWTADLADAASAEKPLSELLAAPPELEAVEDTKNAPRYVSAQDVSEQIDLVIAELSGYGDPDALYDLADALYANSAFESTLDSANADRIEAISASWDLDGQQKVDAIRAAHTRYWGIRLEALDEEITLNEATLDPTVGLQGSFLAFNQDLFSEEKAYDEQIIADLPSYTQFTNAYLDFAAVVSSGFPVVGPYIDAEVMTTGYAGLAEEYAGALRETIATGEPAALPSIAGPYRAQLIDGFVPVGSENSGARSAQIRLWMLWRIRELEKTPDAAYEKARTMLFEELNRLAAGTEPSTVDPRAGSARLLDAISRFGQSLTGVGSIEHGDAWIAELEEVYRYAQALREGPMIEEVAQGYDDVLAQQRKCIDELEVLIASDADDIDSQIYDMADTVADDLQEAALPAMRYLDDDEEFSKDLAALIEATSPSASESD